MYFSAGAEPRCREAGAPARAIHPPREPLVAPILAVLQFHENGHFVGRSHRQLDTGLWSPTLSFLPLAETESSNVMDDCDRLNHDA